MRYLPRSPLLPSPARTSPILRPTGNGALVLLCSRLALLCLSHSCQLLTVTVAAPALQMDCPNLLCFSCSYQSLSLFFLLVLLPPATSPFLCKWTAPICSASPALATCYQPLFTAPLCRRTAPIRSSYYSYSACSADRLPPFLALHSFRLLSHIPAAAAGG